MFLLYLFCYPIQYKYQITSSTLVLQADKSVNGFQTIFVGIAGNKGEQEEKLIEI